MYLKPFKVNWGRLSKWFAKKFSNSEFFPIKTYFEDEERFLIFLDFGGSIYYSEVVKSLVPSKNFVYEFLSDAEKLEENPFVKMRVEYG